MEHESDDSAHCNWCFWHNNKRIIKRPGGFGSWRTGRDYQNDSIAENGRNPEMSPGDLRRLADTQTPVKKPSANTMAMKGYTLFSKAPPLLAAHHLI